MDPRDALFGGRTNSIRLYAQTELDLIRSSTRRRVIPLVILNLFTNLKDGYVGLLWYCAVQHFAIYRALSSGAALPLRLQTYLSTIRTCIQESIDLPLLDKDYRCSHSPSERPLMGTWCTPELECALRKGY